MMSNLYSTKNLQQDKPLSKKVFLALKIGFLSFLFSGNLFAASTPSLNVTYLDVENYPQKEVIKNPLDLGRIEIGNMSGELISIERIRLYNKGNLNLADVSDLILDLGNGEVLSPTKIVDNNFIFEGNFDIEAGEKRTFSLKGSVLDAKRGEYVQIEIESNKDIDLNFTNKPFIMAPKKSKLRIIGDEMGSYSITKSHSNLPLLAFHVQSDELTLVPNLKLFLDQSIGGDILNMRNSFINFKLFDNERQKFIYPTGNLIEDGLSFEVNSDVWVSGNNHFALFMDTSENAILDTSIRFRLEPTNSIVGAKFLTTKGDVFVEDIDYSNVIGSKVDLVKNAEALEEIPTLPSGITLNEGIGEETPKTAIPPKKTGSKEVIIVDNSDKESEKVVREFTKEIKQREAKKKVYLTEKYGKDLETETLDDLLPETAISDLIDFDSLEFFPDTDRNSLEGIAAAYLRSLGIIGGYPDGEFKGDRFVNRAEITKFLLLGSNKKVLKEVNGSIFPDVQIKSWYEKYVVTANSLNIVNGYPDGTFQPGKNVNTVEFLKMLTNSFKLEKNLKYVFTDVDSAQWFVQFVGNVGKYDLFPRRDPEQLEPAKEMSRNEVAVAIFQILVDRLKAANI